MKVHCQYSALVSISELKLYPKNRNKHSKEQIKQYAAILKYQGIRKPMIVSNQTGFVVTGHGMIEAAKLNGWTSLPVSFQDFEGDQEQAHRIADNAIALQAEIDLAGINLDIPDFDGATFDMEWLGLKDFEMEPADKYGEIKEKELDENLKTDHECPSCGYVW